MKTNNSASLLSRIKWQLALAPLAFLALGLVLLILPQASTRLLCFAVGIAIMVFGVFHVLSFVMDKSNTSYSFELVLGVLALAFGLFAILNPTFLTDFLFIALGVVLMVGSISSLRRALSLRRYGYSAWWVSLLCAVFVFFFALFVILRPDFFTDILMMVIGLLFIASASSDLLSIYRLLCLARSNADVIIR